MQVADIVVATMTLAGASPVAQISDLGVSWTHVWRQRQMPRRILPYQGMLAFMPVLGVHQRLHCMSASLLIVDLDSS